jgi:hypothetical protein
LCYQGTVGKLLEYEAFKIHERKGLCFLSCCCF